MISVVSTVESVPRGTGTPAPSLYQRIRKLLTRDLLVTLALGQVLSLLICAIGLTSKYLADDFHANTPVFQSFLNYILLFLVYTTTLAVRQEEQKLFGDLLVLGGATLYGISNVCEEFIVKNLSRVEFLGMMGLFGSFFSGIQLAIMEHKELLKVPWDWQIGLLYIGFSAFMFGLYSLMPVVMKRTSATSVNLSLLTADLYILFCGLFLFHYKFSGLYLLSFFIIILGLSLYSSSSTYVAQDPRVYKQFRNTGSQPDTDPPQLSPGVLEPAVTYTCLGPEQGDEPPVHVA
ncbi:hypothetical protein PAMP_013790 [Pampus punctatissimus]